MGAEEGVRTHTYKETENKCELNVEQNGVRIHTHTRMHAPSGCQSHPRFFLVIESCSATRNHETHAACLFLCVCVCVFFFFFFLCVCVCVD